MNFVLIHLKQIAISRVVIKYGQCSLVMKEIELITLILEMKKGRFKTASLQSETPKRYEIRVAVFRGDTVEQGEKSACSARSEQASFFVFVAVIGGIADAPAS